MSRLSIRSYTKSIKFDGSTSFLTKASPTGINTGTNSRSFSGWVMLMSDALGCVGQFKVNGSQSPAGLLGQLTGVYYWAIDTVNGGNNLTLTAAEFKANFPLYTWFHVAWVFTTTTASLYVNGTLVKSSSWGVAMNTGTYNNFYFGKSSNSTETNLYFLNGYLKDMRIHNGALSLADVANEYYRNIPSPYLADSYLMEEGSGTSIADGTGSNTLTATSITWSTTVLPTRARTAISSPRVALRPTPYSITNTATVTAGLTIPNNAALNPTSAVTLCAWVYLRTKNSSASSIFDNSQAGTTNSYFFDYLNDATGLRWYSVIGGISRNITTTTFRMKVAEWYFVTATYTGSAIYLYVNGAKLPEEITGISGSLGTNSGQLCIARTWNALAASALVGNIYRPMIFNVGCTLQEHQDLYYSNKFSTALAAGKVLDLAMTEGSGSTIADTSPTGATATIGAGAAWASGVTPFKTRSAASTRSPS